jgi:isoleucyl-tRNA synthetase
LKIPVAYAFYLEDRYMEYKDTLNLPRTDFPMKGNLVELEPRILRRWEEIDIYELSISKTMGNKSFILHDGPPYSNGDIHAGHTLNKVLKDIIIKFKTIEGFYCPYIPGWDNHGMPIENKVLERLRGDRKEINPLELRDRCRQYALKYVDIQREQFKRLGIRGDWDKPYLTLDRSYEATIVNVFSELVEKGYIYRGLRPIHWCVICRTALAEAEIEYEDKTSHSIYVRFLLEVDPDGVLGGSEVNAIIWTTTPWTIPANLAIAVHPNFKYSIVAADDNKKYLMASDLVEQVAGDIGMQNYRIEAELPGVRLEGVKFRHPIFDRSSPVVFADYVTLDQGTGLVHTAPGHGREDFETGKIYDLGVLCPLDENGIFNEDAGIFEGLNLEECNRAVMDELSKRGNLLARSKVIHQYPHCWRCHKPVVFRTTVQWFMSVDHDSLRKRILDEIERVRWIPDWGKNRIYSMMSERPDWCLSRQRYWGVGIPIYYCKKCNEPIMDADLIRRVADEVLQNGSDVWFTKSASDMMPSGYTCPRCGSGEFYKEKDILDVWFDSGSSHRAVLEKRPELTWPAQMYLEGSDQHRGWFNSSLVISLATKDRAPFNEVLTHGFVVDEKGRKMAKSLGNVISPLDIMKKYGADILRLWVASMDYRGDVSISDDILKQVTDAYRRIRNTIRFLLGNLYDFNPDTDQCSYSEITDIDRWALQLLARISESTRKAYEEYEFHQVYHQVFNFCAVEMSSIYLDVLKDRLYVSYPTDRERRSSQTLLFRIARSLLIILSPVLSFTSEEGWEYLPGYIGKPPSPQLENWPDFSDVVPDEKLMDDFDRLLLIRDRVFKAIEELREKKEIGNSLEAYVVIEAGEDEKEFLNRNADTLLELLMVSELDFEYSPKHSGGISARSRRSDHSKCERCWKFLESVGANDEHSTLCKSCASVVKRMIN